MILIEEVTVSSRQIPAKGSTERMYVANKSSLVTITLPSSGSVGDMIMIVGKGAGGWKIAQKAGMQIHVGNVSSTSGASGYIASTHRRDCVVLVCTTAKTEWTVISTQGAITVA